MAGVPKDQEYQNREKVDHRRISFAGPGLFESCASLPSSPEASTMLPKRLGGLAGPHAPVSLLSFLPSLLLTHESKEH